MIDTAEKRRAASGIPFLPLGPGVTPNATADVEWRREAGWSYPFVMAAVTAGGSLFPAGRRYLRAYLEEMQRRSILDMVKVREQQAVDGKVLFDIMLGKIELTYQQRQAEVATYVTLLAEL